MKHYLQKYIAHSYYSFYGKIMKQLKAYSLLFWLLFLTKCKRLSVLSENKQKVCLTGNAVLGTEINLDKLEENTNSYSASAETIKGALVANGVVVIRNQSMDRPVQCNFTQNLGTMIVLPKSFQDKDPEPGLQAIQRVTNYFHNGTWKG